MAILCIHKTANDYHNKNLVQRHSGERSTMPFDERVLTIFVKKREVSIWTIGGRQKMSFAMGNSQLDLLEKRIGQSDLIIENGEFFLLVSYEEVKEKPFVVKDFLGIDLGIKKLAIDSDKEAFSGEAVERIRKKYAKRRKILQKKGTKNSKRTLLYDWNCNSSFCL